MRKLIVAVALLASGCAVYAPKVPDAEPGVPDAWPIAPETVATGAAADIGWRDFFTAVRL